MSIGTKISFAFGCAVVLGGVGTVFGPLYTILFALSGAVASPLIGAWFDREE